MTIDKLANIKIKLLDDPVRVAENMQQTVKGPSIIRTAINSLIVGAFTRGRIRRPVRMTPVRIPQPKPISQPRIPQLPSTSWNRANVPDESIRFNERIATDIASRRSGPLIKRQQLQRGIPPRSIDSAMRDVRVENMRSTIKSVASKPKRQQLQRRLPERLENRTNVRRLTRSYRSLNVASKWDVNEQYRDDPAPSGGRIIRVPDQGQFNVSPETTKNILENLENQRSIIDQARHGENSR